MENNEVRVKVYLPFTSFKHVVHKVVAQPNNIKVQQIDAPINLNEAIINEPAIDVPREVALRKSQSQKRPAISDDYLLYLHES